MEKDNSSIEVWIRIAAAVGEGGEVPSYRLTVKGNSMYPLIRSGIDRVTVEPVGSRQLKRGDIILFPGKANGLSYILHRVYAVEDGCLLTLGDGNLSPDGWISRESVCGIATVIERGKHRLVSGSLWMRVAAECWMRILCLRGVMLVCIRRIGRMRGTIRRIGEKLPFLYKINQKGELNDEKDL